jgi:hypothetical protein
VEGWETHPSPANDYEMPSPSGDAGEENANPPYILSPSSIDELTSESSQVQVVDASLLAN